MATVNKPANEKEGRKEAKGRKEAEPIEKP